MGRRGTMGREGVAGCRLDGRAPMMLYRSHIFADWSERWHIVVVSSVADRGPGPVLLLGPFDLGRAMRSCRVEAGLTQAQLAAAVGVSAKWVSEAENGKPTVEVGKIMEVLGHLGYGLAVEARTEPAVDLAARIESLAQSP